MDLEYLLSMEDGTHVFTAHNMEELANNIIITLRENRRNPKLSDNALEKADQFILMAFSMSKVTEGIEIDVTHDDVEYIIEEVALLHMGHARN